MLISRRSFGLSVILALTLSSCESALLHDSEVSGEHTAVTPKPSPAKFIEAFDWSNTGTRSPVELGMAYHSSTAVYSESPFTSGTAITINRSWRPTMVGTTYVTSKASLLSSLPIGETIDSLADLHVEIGLDSKTLAFLNNLQFDDRTLCAVNSATGQVDYEKYFTNTVVDPRVATEIASVTPSSPSEKYGDRYVRSIAKGFCAFFLIHLRVSENATYDFQTVKEAFYRLQGVGFGYVPSEKYTQDQISSDWTVLKSDGNQIQTYAYSDLSIEGISTVKTTNEFFSYYQELQKASIADTLSSKCTVAKVILTEYGY